jgi:hypothetical protein
MHEGGVLAGKPEGKRPFGKPNYRWGIILKWFFKKCDGTIWNGFIYVDHDRDKRLIFREGGNETSGSTMRRISRLAEKRFSFSWATLFHGVREPHSYRARAQPLCYAGCVKVPSFGINRLEPDDNFLPPFVAEEASK